jgi:hypothetical protein
MDSAFTIIPASTDELGYYGYTGFNRWTRPDAIGITGLFDRSWFLRSTEKFVTIFLMLEFKDIFSKRRFIFILIGINAGESQYFHKG